MASALMASRSSLLFACLVAATMVLVTPSAAATLSVCPDGCAYSLPSAAYADAVAGDTIQVEAATYTDCIYIEKDYLTIKGVNGIAKMTGKICGQKGILVTAAKGAILQNLELYGVSCSENCAGIRHDAAGFDLTIDNLYIHDCDDGLLGSASGDTITITNTLFENNGYNAESGQAHNMYFGHHASVVFRNSISRAAKLGGHELKTRALRTEIDSSILATLGGDDSRLIDCSNGGTLIVRNCVLENGPSSENNNMIGFDAEGTQADAVNSVTVSNNIIIGDRSSTIMLNFFELATTIIIEDNTFINIGTITNAGTDTGSTIYSSREAAEYPAYPWLPSLSQSTVVSSTGPNNSPSSTTYSASVLFILTFNAASSTTSQASFMSTVQSDVATMAGVSVQQVLVSAVSFSAESLSARRLLQSSTSGQLQVIILASSNSAAQVAYKQFNAAWSSSNPGTNLLLAENLDTSSSLTSHYYVVCANGSFKDTASECNKVTNNGAASTSSNILGLIVAIFGATLL